MKAKHIIIGLLIVFVLYFLYTKNASKKTEFGQLNSSSNIPEAVQKELPYFDEGEILKYSGSTYQKLGGSWMKI